MMASLASTYKELARISSRHLRRNGASRGFHTSSRALAAQNFTMPAMSPTMTEGNIASWKVKEGDKFSTGDVLLEIETDKAQMDVEAQEDGIMAKIMQPDGTKGVKVGTRIGVIAEPDDDLSNLSLPNEDKAPASSPQEETKSGIDPSKSSESQAEAPPSSKGADTPSSTPSSKTLPSKSSSSKPTKQTYPLYPSVAQLLHEKGLPSSEADKIPASGPKGRLLKGDVLAYLGTINSSYSSDQSIRISKLGHLDISYVKIAPPKQVAPPPVTKAAPSTPAPEPDTEIAVPISLKAVREIQQRFHDTLGIDIPLSTFITRAIDISNDDLPRSKTSPPTSNELFNQILGLDTVSSKTSRGSFTPQITALPPAPAQIVSKTPARIPDIIDLLTNPPSSAVTKGLRTSPVQGVMAGYGTGASTNVISISVAKGQELQGKMFLERMKTVLQVEPGRLVV